MFTTQQLIDYYNKELARSFKKLRTQNGSHRQFTVQEIKVLKADIVALGGKPNNHSVLD